MAEKDLLNIIRSVASDAEALGFPKTAISLRRIIQDSLAKKGSFSTTS